ncbi:MAG TPA: AAA family ATPase, partial [Cellvibrionaceae bacterium]|nr:AAA family ATPase [Cellvibrionaceae bacterium]
IVDKIWSAKAEAFETEHEPWIYANRLNIFIGPNNSGKSLFNRALISKEFQWVDETVPNKLLKMLELYKIHISQHPRSRLISPAPTPPGADIIQELKNAIENLSRPVTKDQFDTTKFLLDQHTKFLLKEINRDTSFSGPPYRELYNSIINEPQDIFKIPMRQEQSWHYIPILRGLRPLTNSLDNHYSMRTQKDYSTDCNTHTGLELYDLITSHLLGEPEEREKVRNYEKMLSENFFNYAEVSLTPKIRTDTLHAKIGHEKQRPIYQLGDGLQTVIIITAAAFFTEKPSLFAIEEPETHLHPGFQRRLIEVLLDKTPHQYFVTTHSNHLLELAECRDEISIFRVNKEPGEQTKFKISVCDQDRDLLRELGVNPASVYLANCTIWVEGITDRLYIQAFLEQYKKHNPGQYDHWIENYHYTFVEYQGAGLAHWEFADEQNHDQEQMLATITTPNILVIADGDIETKGNRQGKLESQLAEKLYITPGKEIDNLVPTEVIKSFVKARIDGMIKDNKENKAKIQRHNIKPENIDRLHNLSNEQKGIGWHIDKLLFGRDPTEDEYRLFSKLGSATGTIRQKVELCRYATAKMRAEEWEMSEEIKKLCEIIFEHIAENNTTGR